MKTYTDQQRTCVACGAGYTWNSQDQKYAATMGFFAPKRCVPCREIEKAKRRRERAAHDSDRP